jgi:septal ring factor EnvC (AmiA/AmiB activator)
LPTIPITAKAEDVLRLALCFLLIAASAAVAASGPVQPEQLPLDVAVELARREAATAVAQQKRLEKAASEARDEASRLQVQQLAAAKAIAAAEARISAADGQALIAQARLAEQRRRLAAQQAPASALLAGLVLMARRPPLLVLADSRSTDDLVKLRLLLDSTLPAIRSRTAALAGQVERTRRLEQAAVSARRNSIETRDQLARERTAFAELEARAARLAQARGAEAFGASDAVLGTREQLSELERGSATRSRAAEIARELARFGPAPIPPPGSVERPPIRYVLPANAAVTEGLGSVSANGVRSRGVSLATRRGAALIAPADGTILFAGPFRDYDGIVIIDHGGGWKSVLVNAGSKHGRGSKVKIGEPLGTALGAVEVQLQHEGRSLSPAIIAGSSAMLSNMRKGG